ncbi:hypothetical protein GH714_013130 [Hevea brasiliensis]|uniref:Uncharacterized protein n=1 Tax=Hevea brasiliensis TaxID=3981 RepID=A0A6A6KBR2_HEVBR|nr:hypothetical protein GH714_013130 [Hevea brasiliensis]
MKHWSTLEWIAKSCIAAQNWRSETDGPGTGLSKHIGGSSSTVEHNLKMDQMEAMVVAATTDATSNSQDDDSQEISINVNRLCLDIVGGEKKQRVYGLGSHASTLYLDSFSSSATSRRTATVIDNVTDERIRVLEEEIVRKKENQERILKQCIEDEVSRLRQQSEEQFRSM